MRVRFLEVCDSEVPGFPFKAGQVIEIARLTPAMMAAIRDQRAELIREEAGAAAIVEAPERAVTTATKHK